MPTAINKEKHSIYNRWGKIFSKLIEIYWAVRRIIIFLKFFAADTDELNIFEKTILKYIFKIYLKFSKYILKCDFKIYLKKNIYIIYLLLIYSEFKYFI